MKAIAVFFSIATLYAADPANYKVFRHDGTPASFEDVIAAARNVEVVFLGESHDDPTAHALEAEVLQKLHAAGPVLLSLEMFERDVQYVLDEYLAGLIGEDHLISSGRAWRNYKTDYRPMVEFAKEKKLVVIAANAPRRYVNRVSRLGVDSLADLSAQAKATLPPLPFAEASEAYSTKFHNLMKRGREEAAKEAAKKAAEEGKPAPTHTPSVAPSMAERRPDPARTLQAQSLWDAGMAFSIAEAGMRHPGVRILHVNGSFHSEERMGILDHLKRYRPQTTSLVVTMNSAKSYPNWDAELAGKGDFVILTDPKLERSFKSVPPASANTK